MKSIMLIKLTTAKQKMRGVLTFEQSTLPRISMGWPTVFAFALFLTKASDKPIYTYFLWRAQ